MYSLVVIDAQRLVLSIGGVAAGADPVGRLYGEASHAVRQRVSVDNRLSDRAQAVCRNETRAASRINETPASRRIFDRIISRAEGAIGPRSKFAHITISERRAWNGRGRRGNIAEPHPLLR